MNDAMIQQFKQLADQRPPGCKSVVVASPVQDMCHSAFASSLVNMMTMTMGAQPDNLQFVNFQAYSSSILPFARQVLAKTVMEMRATHVLFIDSDMDFPADTVLRMLKHEHPIVGINASTRRAPLRCTARS